MKANRSRFAVLGLLAEKPSTGYDIRKRIEQEMAHFWNESYGQIYPILNGLAEERLATRRRRKQKGRPDRQVYSITPRGRKLLHEWLVEPSAAQTERNETLLKLLFAGSLSAPETRELIDAYREKQQESLESLGEIETTLRANADEGPDPGLGLLTVSHSRAEARARIRWCDHVLRELETSSRRIRKRRR